MIVDIKALDKINNNESSFELNQLIKSLKDNDNCLIASCNLIDNKLIQNVSFINISHEMIAQIIINMLSDNPEIVIEMNRLSQLNMLEHHRNINKQNDKKSIGVE